MHIGTTMPAVLLLRSDWREVHVMDGDVAVVESEEE